MISLYSFVAVVLAVTFGASAALPLAFINDQIQDRFAGDPADWGDTPVLHNLTAQQLSSRSVEPMASTPLQPLRLCATVDRSYLPIPLLALTWAHYHKDRYLARGVNVTGRVIGTVEALPAATRAARAVVAQSDNCDAFLGTALSSMAQVAAVVVSKNWLDLASSSALSDQTQTPFFSRVYPDTEQDGVVAAALVKSLGITAVHTLCTDEAYGRSASEGFTATATTTGIEIVSRRCFLPSASVSEIAATLHRIAERKETSQWVYLAVGATRVVPLLKAAHEAGLNRTLTFISSRCPSDAAYPGLICTGPMLNGTMVDEAFAARDHDLAFRDSVISDFLTIAGAPPASALLNARGTAVIIDAVEVLVEAYVQFRVARPDVTNVADHQAALRDFMRANVTLPMGVLGPVQFTAGGNRFVSVFDVFNAAENRTFVRVGRLNRTNTAEPFTLTSQIYLPSIGMVGLPLPTRVHTPTSSDDGLPVALWVGLGLGILVVLVLVAFVVALVLRPKSARDLANAPTDGAVPFSIVFTDIQASTALWAAQPEHMGPALDAHNALIRKQIHACDGYEVKTVGDCFMVAFKSAPHAVLFAVEIQKALWAHEWGTQVFDEHYIGEPCGDPASPTGPWHGLRVRVGVSHGAGKIVFDDVTKGYDYYGTVVNTAARAEGVAHGGQVLITEAVFEELTTADKSIDAALSDHAFELLGPQQLRGLSEAVVLYQWHARTAPLSRRTYPPLRLDVENVVEDDTRDAGRGGSTGDNGGEDMGSAYSNQQGGKDGAATSVAFSLLALAEAAVSAVRPRRANVQRPSWFGGSPMPTDASVNSLSVDARTVSNASPPAMESRTSHGGDGGDSGGEKELAAVALKQSYSEMMALLRPALSKSERRAVFEKVAKAWRVQDPTTVKATRHLAHDGESKLALMLMGAMLKGKAAAEHRSSPSH